ncbi:MAG: DUF2092 domain-containing protein [Planctomycetes bacterium]|nr:DUF2092 domain-containing protein [Planctomycetota bacterium]
MSLSRLFSASALLLFAVPALAQEAKHEDAKPASAPAAAQAPKDSAKATAALERVMGKLAAKKDSPMSFDMEMSMSIMGMQLKGTGKVFVSGGKQQRMEQTMEGPGIPSGMRITIVNDGETVWILQPAPGVGNVVMKGTPADYEKMQKSGGMGGGTTMDPMSRIKEMTKSVAFDTIEETVADDATVWAISGDFDPAKMPAQMKQIPGVKRMRLLFSKENDWLVGETILNTKGEPVVTTRTKNFNFEPKFEESTFKFTPPEGAQVMNLADLMRGGGMDDDEEEEDEDEDEDAPASKPASKPAK